MLLEKRGRWMFLVREERQVDVREERQVDVVG